jgi:CRISPR-associated protein Cmr2
VTAYLLAISIGPVQEFVAAARRTRDLCLGSRLLSEISKAAARAVNDVVQAGGGELIFPAAGDPADLSPDSPLNVANVILAELRGPDPAKVARAAREAANAHWRRKFADPVFHDNRSVIRADIWAGQVDDVIEFYSAWVPLGDNYRDARRRLRRLLTGRKNCRDFLPAKGRAGVPKSSLDGLRESVLKDPESEPWPAHVRRRLRLKEGEQLDVLGLVKRTAEGHQPYPSAARVAADPWLLGLTAAYGDSVLGPLCEACQALGPEVMHRLDTSAKQGHPHYNAFPYEGTAVFRSRHHELWEESREEHESLDESRKKFRPLEAALGELESQASALGMTREPSPCLAVLVADGDRMGDALSRLESVEEHRQFSRQLSRFAGDARTIVREQRGVLVYSGGDDVLAFVPLDTCLTCARTLYEKFGQLMESWTQRTRTSLALSVGLAIGHFLENMEDLLDYGRAAEKHAKQPRPSCIDPADGRQEPRDGLAVHLLKRGGGPIEVRANWSKNWWEGMDQRLQTLAQWINDRALSGRAAYDLRKIADVYTGDAWPDGTAADAIRRDALSVLKAKQPRGESRMKEVEEVIRERVNDAASLRRFAAELLIARQLAVALRQASHQPGEVPA